MPSEERLAGRCLHCQQPNTYSGSQGGGLPVSAHSDVGPGLPLINPLSLAWPRLFELVYTWLSNVLSDELECMSIKDVAFTVFFFQPLSIQNHQIFL